MSALGIVLAFIAVQRLGELVCAGRNTRVLRAAGAAEYGAGHYPLIVALHAAWLMSLLLFVPWNTPPNWIWLGLFVLLQPLRLWIVASLGPRWTTRVIVPSDTIPVRRGPYRWLRHPNYAVVAAEIAVLPLAFGASRIAAIFSAFNAALLTWRIHVENEALGYRRIAASVTTASKR